MNMQLIGNPYKAYIELSNDIEQLDNKKYKSLEDLERMERLMSLHSEYYDDIASIDNANNVRSLINPYVCESYRI